MAFATINGARLWYTELGNTGPAAPAILFHHGYTASRVNWLPAASRMTSHYRVILMECRGTGESEHTADGYTLAQYAADVICMADHLGLTRFTYAGHSMGGAVGVVTAAEDARLRHLICLAPMVQTVRFSEAEFGTVTPDAGCMWDDPACPLSSTFVNDLRNMGSILTAAEKLPLPVLIIHGQEDDLVPVSEAEALYHAVLHEHPVSLVRLLTDHVFSGEATSAMCHEVVEWLAAQTD